MSNIPWYLKVVIVVTVLFMLGTAFSLSVLGNLMNQCDGLPTSPHFVCIARAAKHGRILFLVSGLFSLTFGPLLVWLWIALSDTTAEDDIE